MAPRHLFVGNLALDDMVYPNGQTRMAAPGGNSLYAAVGAKIWSDDVGLVALVGRDWPDAHTRALQSRGIDVTGLTRLPAETLRSWVLYEPDGRRTYVSRNSRVGPLTPGPYSSLPPTLEQVRAFAGAARETHAQMSPTPQHLPAGYRWPASLHLCPMPLPALLAWELPPSISMSLDILPFPAGNNLNQPELLKLLTRADAFLPSRAEAKLLFPGYNPRRLCRQLAQRGPEVVVIKEGARGSLVYHRQQNRLWRVPACPANVVDPTGAGDSFCGGFAVGLAQTGDPLEAALRGTVSASFVIEAPGGLHALKTTRAAAQKRLSALKQRLSQP
ncbi:MAG: carbohydrate kinase family protein [Anaerolineae bacterium]